MSDEGRKILRKYLICFLVASIITVAIFWIKGFFTDDTAVNIQILSDGFSVAGILLLLAAGMMFVSGQGGLIGIGFVMKSVAQAFIPMGRKNHEFYAQYRERKMAEKGISPGDSSLWVVGLIFLAIGIVFSVIWYTKYCNVVL